MNFSSLFVAIFQGSIHSDIQNPKGVNIHNNIQTVMLTKVLHEVFSSIFKLIRSGHVN